MFPLEPNRYDTPFATLIRTGLPSLKYPVLAATRFELISQYAISSVSVTIAGGEVVTLQQFPGNWFSISSNGVYIQKLKNGLPKYFTVEFDLIIDGTNQILYVDFEDALDGNFSRHPANPYLQFRIYDGGSAYVENKGKNLETHVKSSAYNTGGKINHFAIRKEGERLRIYINQEKTFDINQAFEGNRTYSTFKFGADFNNPTHMLVSNVKIAGL